ADAVYCCISDPQNPAYRTVITGPCVVFRNPCFHPGDIRVVTAVKVKALDYLVDVLVFPTLGYRDLPSQCSGGDLDGDDFTTFWDQNLITKNKNWEPMNYEAPKAAIVDEVKMVHIKKFFVNYILSDQLGSIANSHLAKADYLSGGAFHGQCIRLAQLHSEAVDFPKTGIPAEFPVELRPSKYPDFMEKPDKPVYESEKILGKLYRSIEVEPFDPYTNITFDERLYVPGFEEYLEDARFNKRSYTSDIRSLINQFGVMSEYETVSGFIVNPTIKVEQKKPREVKKSVMDAVTAIQKQYRKVFEEEFYGEGTNLPSPDARNRMEAKAFAWYYVTYHPAEIDKDGEENLMSFPWIVHSMLCDIAIRNTNRFQSKEEFFSRYNSIFRTSNYTRVDKISSTRSASENNNNASDDGNIRSDYSYRNGEELFWHDLDNNFRSSCQGSFDECPPLRCRGDFLKWFAQRTYEKPVVLFIDEFDRLYSAAAEIRDGCLSTIRAIKHMTGVPLHSVVAVGTFAILALESNNYTSPFNIQNPFQNPNLTHKEVESLFTVFASDRSITIDSNVVEDIHWQTNGHANLVCICGKAIDDKMTRLLELRHLPVAKWKKFVITYLIPELFKYATFKSIITTLKASTSKEYVVFLRSHFLYDPYAQVSVNYNDDDKVIFLSRHGILRPGEEPYTFMMASPLLSAVIQQCVIPAFFPCFPKYQPPSKLDESLDLLGTLKAAVYCFDQQTLINATKHSHKQAHVDIGKNNVLVPRESVYQQELTSILSNWFKQWLDYYVEAQCCLCVIDDGCSMQKYCDIIITNPRESAAIIELVATETWQKVEEHYQHTLQYAESKRKEMPVSEIWTVHFTCEQNYLVTGNPCLPTMQQHRQGLGAIHFWHNLEFSEVHMSACYPVFDINDEMSLMEVQNEQ
ncbi:20050_t:CDS:2, partial [Entrophospora sp. SA101]